MLLLLTQPLQQKLLRNGLKLAKYTALSKAMDEACNSNTDTKGTK
jgi:hypothetical protein